MEEFDRAQQEENECADRQAAKMEAVEQALARIERSLDDWAIFLRKRVPACLEDLEQAIAEARQIVGLEK